MKAWLLCTKDLELPCSRLHRHKDCISQDMTCFVLGPRETIRYPILPPVALHSYAVLWFVVYSCLSSRGMLRDTMMQVWVPMDTIKERLQIEGQLANVKEPLGSSTRALRIVIQKEGIRGLFPAYWIHQFTWMCAFGFTRKALTYLVPGHSTGAISLSMNGLRHGVKNEAGQHGGPACLRASLPAVLLIPWT